MAELVELTGGIWYIDNGERGQKGIGNHIN